MTNIPQGWKLVPVEPTEKMQRAYFASIDKHMKRVETDLRFGRYDNHKIGYRAMIAAAPDAVDHSSAAPATETKG